MTVFSYTETQYAAQGQFEPLLNPKQAAALLLMHPKTLVRLAREGRIPGHRVGKNWCFRASELNRWIDEPAQVVKSQSQSDRVHGDSQ
jgi:excisionase family DNA binding protein